MNTSTLPSPTQLVQFKKDHFGRALTIGAVIEALMIGGLIYSNLSQPVTVKPQPKIMAIHMIQPSPPKPKPVPPTPKPVVHPKPTPKPVPQPIPRPAPHPVAHHPLPPKPLLAKTPAPQAPVHTPPVTPPAPPPPAPNPAARQSAIDTYAAMLRARVQANAHVPDSVRMMHVGGTAVISFRLTPSGHLLSAHLARSSGIGAINRAALKTVEDASFPPFTKKMPKRDMKFDVRVHLSAHDS